MKYTSAEANKLLRQLNEQKERLLNIESRSSTFIASVGEDIEDVRPEYSYEKVQEQIDMLNHRIRTVKHAINVFNATQVCSGFDMTIDEMLVYIPQLTQQKEKLEKMASRLPKERDNASFGSHSSLIDYRYANYNVQSVVDDFRTVSERLSKAQLALDKVNTEIYFEIEI